MKKVVVSSRHEIPVFVIDPEKPTVYSENVIFIQEKAGVEVSGLKN